MWEKVIPKEVITEFVKSNDQISDILAKSMGISVHDISCEHLICISNLRGSVLHSSNSKKLLYKIL